MKNEKIKIKNTRAMAEEKKFFWISKVLFLFTIIALISNLILFFVSINLVPNVKIQPFFIEMQNVQSKDILVYKNFQNIDNLATSNETDFFKIKEDSPSYKIAENYVKNYIVDRETVTRDLDFMYSTWGNKSDLFYLSSAEVYNRFSETEVFTSVIKNRMGFNWERTVEIIDLEYQPEAKRWTANVLIRFIQPNGKVTNTPLKRKFIVEGTYDLKIMKKNQENLYKNPLGFKITNYYFKKL